MNDKFERVVIVGLWLVIVGLFAAAVIILVHIKL